MAQTVSFPPSRLNLHATGAAIFLRDAIQSLCEGLVGFVEFLRLHFGFISREVANAIAVGEVTPSRRFTTRPCRRGYL